MAARDTGKQTIQYNLNEVPDNAMDHPQPVSIPHMPRNCHFLPFSTHVAPLLTHPSNTSFPPAAEQTTPETTKDLKMSLLSLLTHHVQLLAYFDSHSEKLVR